MSPNTADTYARMAISDSLRIIEAREYARRARAAGRRNLARAAYATSARNAELVRGYADTLIHAATYAQVSP